MAQCKARGLNVLITETIRTVQYQDELYAKGRTAPGNVVTSAKGSTYSSPHQWGLAFDICKNVRGHEYDDAAFFETCGAVGRSLGLHWGGDFKSAKDRPHFQWDGKNGVFMPTGVTTQLKAMYGTPEAFKKTWKEVEDVTNEELDRRLTEFLNGSVAKAIAKGIDDYFSAREKLLASTWAKADLAKAITAGITDGTKPQGFATREQMAIAVMRAAGK
jgi:peptidoglycan L-alanyl-D-glutamate endopeptidase CwlK